MGKAHAGDGARKPTAGVPGKASKVTAALREAARAVSGGDPSSGESGSPSETPTVQAAQSKPGAKKAAATKRPVGKKITVKKSTAKKSGPAPTTTSPVKQSAAKSNAVSAATVAPAAKKSSPKPPSAKKAAVKSTPTSTTTTTTVSATTATVSATPTRARLKVREDEQPWTTSELAGVKSELEEDIARLTHELAGIEHEIADLIGDSGDGAGDDQADVGSKSFEREHEFTLAQNSREMLDQCEHALERIADGTYGICESCDNPIGKLRLQAFPRATLCLQCKQKQERR